ncbi:MAG: hypothetical protein ACLTSZ_07530 [Lachnospiraceae bacterium]
MDELILESRGCSCNQKTVSLCSQRRRHPQLLRSLWLFWQDDHCLTISSPEFCYTYDKLIGVFTKMVATKIRSLTVTVRWSGATIWRAPTDNDRIIENEWRTAQPYDRNHGDEKLSDGCTVDG